MIIELADSLYCQIEIGLVQNNGHYEARRSLIEFCNKGGDRNESDNL